MNGAVRSFLAVSVRAINCVTCHRNGTVSYYDHARNVWLKSQPNIPLHVLTMLSRDEEARVRRHMLRHGIYL
jgi:hypothetical protein